MARRNKGVVARHPLDFNLRNAMAGAIQINASGGNLAHVELYNNDKSGNYLYPYSLSTAGSAVTQFTIEYYQGQKATINGVYGTDFAALLIGGPQLAGLFGGFYSASCVGTHIGQSPGAAGGANVYQAFPYAAVPPGYSFCLECQSANVTMVGAIWWLVDGAP